MGRSPKLVLLALAGLFFLPLALAWMMYSGLIDFRPAETSNIGVLVDPPIPVQLPGSFEQLGLSGHWLLLHPLPANCVEDCLAFTTGLRQVRRALGRDGARLRIVYLLDSSPDNNIVQKISAIDPEAVLFPDGSGMLRSQLEEFNLDGGTLMIDPLGNIMMHYHEGSDPNNIRLDLKRLLKYAKTDPQER